MAGNKSGRKNGINRKMVSMFLGFTLAILFFVWLSIFLLFNAVYTTFRTRELQRRGRDFVALYQSGDTVAATAYLYKYGGMDGYVFDQSGEIVFSALNTTDYMVDTVVDKEKFVRFKRVVDSEFSRNVNEFEGVPCVISLDRNGDGDVVRIIYCEEHVVDGQDLYFYVSSGIVPSRTLNGVLVMVCALISIIAVLTAMVVAMDLTEQISRPIQSLTIAANRFARGDRSITFVANDFDELQRLSEVLNYSNKELMRLDNFRRDLLANVSHDLRTPLTLIKGNAELIRDLTGDNKEKRDKQLAVIISEIDRLNLMIDDILNLTRLQSGMVQFEFKSVELRSLIQSVFDGFDSQREKGFEFVMSAPDEIYVYADEGKLKQVVYNLVGNAVNYSGDSRRIEVNVYQKAADLVRVEVRDYGVGMTPEEIEGIWLRYYRSQRMSGSVLGSGLGLNIVYSILSGMKAVFGVNSEVNKGSTFWFEIAMPKEQQE